MDFSRLHMYSPPQCVPENTGYTYALSSSYSSDALDFETEHKLDPVFDSPRMSRRSLRLATTACTLGDGEAVGADGGASSAVSLKNRAARTAKQRRSTNKSAFSINHVSRQVTSFGVSHSGTDSLQDAVTRQPPVLDESWIREQTTVDHFWGESLGDADRPTYGWDVSQIMLGRGRLWPGCWFAGIMLGRGRLWPHCQFARIMLGRGRLWPGCRFAA
ncbi:SUN domain-containing protein 1 isoform X25 [Macaca thibetana thibetana]|uniref:SUN domain-containing protein 1 isoform X25 n=1 Tax=Macaca thibetana thibetana TaxID=257877 RepID=UPI0021BC80EC|nr:SUN domain-containing protein 1 isoform X25 [Macaca thibetana thibetana]